MQKHQSVSQHTLIEKMNKIKLYINLPFTLENSLIY